MQTGPTTLHAGAAPDGGLARFLTQVPGAASAFALIVGDLVLIGWRFHLEAFKSVLPGSIAMNPVTALALALSGLSLWLLREDRPGSWSVRLGRGYGVVVAFIGALRLAGYAAGWDRGVDTVWFAEKLQMASGGWRDRMAPNTAVACLLLGASLALMDAKTRRGHRPAQPLALAAMLLAAFALVGYAFGVAPVHGWSAFTPMALHAVAAMLVLGAGVLCARPNEGLVRVIASARPAESGSAELQTRMRHMEAELFRSAQTIESVNRKLAAASKELESFSNSVSHDLREPLEHVSGSADLLARHAGPALDATGRRYVDEIRGGAQRMGALIDDLLQFSKMSRAEVNATRVALRACVEQIIADLHDETASRAIEWRVGALPDVDADASMLRQVLAQLIGNAVKYSQTKPEAVIEIGALDGDAGEVVVFVRDNGVGFDMQHADKLFGVFQRLHRAEEFEGTGIGLASVRRIIERHGGRTWAEGRPDRGAIFYFSLPQRADSQARAS